MTNWHWALISCTIAIGFYALCEWLLDRIDAKQEKHRIGRRISRSEALRIAGNTLHRAEQRRRTITEWESRNLEDDTDKAGA